MSNIESTEINRKDLSDEDTKKISKLLDSDESPLIAFNCDELGNINCFISTTFDISDQRFKNILSEDFIISEGSNSVAVNMGGESTTRSFPV